MTLGPHTRPGLSEVTSIGGRSLAFCAAFVISRQSTLMAGTWGTVLRGSKGREFLPIPRRTTALSRQPLCAGPERTVLGASSGVRIG